MWATDKSDAICRALSTPHSCRLAKVGWIFTQSAAERDYIMSSEEVQQMAAMQVTERNTPFS